MAFNSHNWRSDKGLHIGQRVYGETHISLPSALDRGQTHFTPTKGILHILVGRLGGIQNRCGSGAEDNSFGQMATYIESTYPLNCPGSNTQRILCYNGQSSWLQIQRSGFDSLSYQIFREVVGLERGPLSLVSTTEELLDRKCSGSCLENRYHCRSDSSR
jgi:hypothetical protein